MNNSECSKSPDVSYGLLNSIYCTVSQSMLTNSQLPSSPNPFKNVVIFSGRSCDGLAHSICDKLDMTLGNLNIENFANGEINIEICESVRFKDVIIVQSPSQYEGNSINDFIMETLFLIDACHRSNSRKIVLVIPNFPYARSDKKDHRGPISSKCVMDILTRYVNRIITVDLHAGQIQAFPSIPCDNLYAINQLCDSIKINIINHITNPNDNFVLISPDAGGVRRVNEYSEKLHINNVSLSKFRDYTTVNTVSKSTLVGDVTLVKNKTGIIIDDMIDTMGTMMSGIKELETHGISNIVIVATHGILSGKAIERINNCDLIKNVIVTNSVSQQYTTSKCSKLIVVDISTYIAEVLNRFITGGSISELFNR